MDNKAVNLFRTPFFIKIFKRNLGSGRRRRSVAGILAAIYILGTASFFYLYYLPRQDEIAHFRQEAVRNERRIRELTQYRDMIPDLKRRVQEAKLELEKTAARVPRDNDLPLVLAAMSEVAQKSRLTLTALDHTAVDWKENTISKPAESGKKSPQPSSAISAFTGQVRIRATVKGSYNGLVAFVSSVERIFPTLQFEIVEISAEGGKDGRPGDGTVVVSLTSSLWVRKGEGVNLPYAGSWERPGVGEVEIPAWRSPFLPYKVPVMAGAAADGETKSDKEIRLTGVVRSGSEWRGILRVGKRTYMVRPGDQVEGMQIVDMNWKGIVVRVKGEQRFIELGKGDKR